METPVLVRLEGAAADQVRDQERLSAGLRLHLQHTDLVCVLMQLGTAQQAYLSAEGCAGCLRGRCVPGCYLELLRRLVGAAIPLSQLQVVPRGLAARPYTRLVLARPTVNARALDGALLAPWDDARLLVHWRGHRGQIAVAAVLAVGAAGPEPAEILEGYGWSRMALPRVITQTIAQKAIPTSVPFHRPWNQAPALLLAANHQVEETAATPEIPEQTVMSCNA